MLDIRTIFYVIGILLSVLGAGMFLPALIDLRYGNPDAQVFLLSAGLTLFVGVGVALSTKEAGEELTLKGAFLMTTLIWAILPAFAAMPFMYSELDMSFTDAYFEAMSGLTTTGATVITGLDNAPPGLLFWRGILQWLGGLGIVVMAVAVLPVLGVGGMQLFRAESFDTTGNIIPRAKVLATMMVRLYVGLTVAAAILLMVAGMRGLDGMVHAMTSIATGGFSTSDGSVGHFDSLTIDIILMFCMILGSIPFVLIIQLIRGRPLALWRDGQVRTFLGLLAVLILVIASWLTFEGGMPFTEALQYGGFNVISNVTGTGYANADYSAWGAFPMAFFMMIMFIGGCAGSTACGVKIFRVQVLFSSLWAQIKLINQPHAIFKPRFNNKPIPIGVTGSVMSYLFLLFLAFIVTSLALSFTGLDYVTSLSGASSALMNVGPGLGEVIGPAGTYQPLPDSAKWILSTAMLVGRLELFSVLVLFTPTFWRA
ncbi:MAG: TrkH family potassium uptake protein [Sphingomonadales bacterium]|nr:TrkH family potassium uptake protein [Sphingomonadales bacterium]